MATIQKEKLESSLQKFCKYHILYIGYSKQAQRELKKNIARLFEALAFSKQIEALHTLQYLGDIGTTRENLMDLAEGGESDRYEASGETNSSEWLGQTDEIEKNITHLFACALDSVEAGTDLNLGELNVCSKCGYVLPGGTPKECGICHAPSGFFRLF